MLSSRVLLETPALRVAEIGCPGGDRAWSPPEPVSGPGFVLVRRGVYRRWADGAEVVADAGTAYVQRPGEQQRVAHPAGGDLCTSLAVRDVPAFPAAGRALLLTGDVQVAHRSLIRAAHAGAGPVTVTDLTVDLVRRLLGSSSPGPDVTPGERRLAADAREALAADRERPLPDLARDLAASPYRVSRVFHRAHGVTLSRYRVRLRCADALERLLGGDRDLARLAAETGFADQAHLTRALRAGTGLTPGRLRTLLGPR